MTSRPFLPRACRAAAALLLMGAAQMAWTPALASGACHAAQTPEVRFTEPKIELESALSMYTDCKLLQNHWEVTTRGLKAYEKLLAKEEAEHGIGKCPGAQISIDRIQRGRTLMRQVAQVRSCQLEEN